MADTEIESVAVTEALAAMRARTSSTFRTESGIEFDLNSVPSAVIQRGLQAIKEPIVPTVEVDGESEENPSDPDYLAAMDQVAIQRINTAFQIYMVLGTSLRDVPKTLHRPESPEWSRKLVAAGITVATDPELRYMDWLKLYAPITMQDMAKLAGQIMALSGTMEADVLAAVNWFRSSKERHTAALNPTERNV